MWRGGCRLDLSVSAPFVWRCLSGSEWSKPERQHRFTESRPYGLLPEPSARNTYQLTDEYIMAASDDVAEQLSKAGVRLAFILNKALRKQ